MFEIKQVFDNNDHEILHDLGLGSFNNLEDAQLALHQYVMKLIQEHHLENDILEEAAMETIIRGDDMRRAGKRVYRIVKAGEERGQK